MKVFKKFCELNISTIPGGQKPFIIVTQNERLVKLYQHKRIEVFVMTLGDYLNQFWPDLASARDVFESLQAVHTEKLAEGDSRSGKVT